MSWVTAIRQRTSRVVHFTVRIDALFQPHAPAHKVGANDTFEPVARTACHTHPLAQTLLITACCGWGRRKGSPVEEVHPGDVVWFSAPLELQ